jgi:hypothetical protein
MTSEWIRVARIKVASAQVDSADADGVRASKIEHSVEDLGRDGDFSGPGVVAVEAQLIPDDLLPARELALDTGPLIIEGSAPDVR